MHCGIPIFQMSRGNENIGLKKLGTVQLRYKQTIKTCVHTRIHYTRICLSMYELMYCFFFFMVIVVFSGSLKLATKREREFSLVE